MSDHATANNAKPMSHAWCLPVEKRERGIVVRLNAASIVAGRTLNRGLASQMRQTVARD
jgi:hypothetical protein